MACAYPSAKWIGCIFPSEGPGANQGGRTKGHPYRVPAGIGGQTYTFDSAEKGLLCPFWPHFRPQKRGCSGHCRGFFSGIHISHSCVAVVLYGFGGLTVEVSSVKAPLGGLPSVFGCWRFDSSDQGVDVVHETRRFVASFTKPPRPARRSGGKASLYMGKTPTGAGCT